MTKARTSAAGYRNPFESAELAEEVVRDKGQVPGEAQCRGQLFSRYIQTTSSLSASGTHEVDTGITIRLVTSAAALAFAEQVRKRNVFARHSWEKHFYVQRAEELAGRTVIEVLLPGNPDDMLTEARHVAELVQRILLLSSTLVLPRKEMQRLIGVSLDRSSEFDITIGPGFNYLRTKRKRRPDPLGVRMDKAFFARFHRCGFVDLLRCCLTTSEMANRLGTVLKWLYESRHEPDLPAALVKTAIALEALLIFSESESLGQTLSERTAFILSQDPNTRRTLSKAVKVFYEVRSGVVHGSRKKAKNLTTSLVEGMDRLVLLLCLMIGANAGKWASTSLLQEWCNQQRWAGPTCDATIPFPVRYLQNALGLCMKQLPATAQ